jgi:hypothetical protein
MCTGIPEITCLEDGVELWHESVTGLEACRIKPAINPFQVKPIAR